MADILALSWDRKRLSGIELSPSIGGPRVSGGFTADWPEQPPTASWLKETLKRHGMSARQVALALPREDAVLRLLELPDVGDAELPTLVRFQAAARSAQSLDQLMLDYLPLPSRSGIPQKDVWLATTPLTTIDPIRAILTGAGLELTQVTLSSLCLAELVARGEEKRSFDPSQASLIILRDGARMEIAVLCRRQLIAAHAVKWSSIQEVPPVAKMVAEVSRLLVQVQAWLPDSTLQRAWVIGDDADVGDLMQAIENRWKCPVEQFELGTQIPGTFSKVQGTSTHLAIAAGLSLLQPGGLTPKLDLLHPRQPPPKRDPRKPYIAAGAAAGLLIAALASGLVMRSLHAMDVSIENLTEEESKLKRDLDSGKATLETFKTVNDWKQRSVNQLDELQELYKVMNGTDRMLVGDYRYANSAGVTIGTLNLLGNAKDRGDSESFAAKLADDSKYRVYPSGLTLQSHDPKYPSRVDFRVDIVPTKPAAAKAKSPPAGAPAPAQKTESP